MNLILGFLNVSTKFVICTFLCVSMFAMFLSGGAINTITRHIDGGLGVLQVKRTPDEVFLAKKAVEVLALGEINVQAGLFQIIAEAIKSVIEPIIKIIGKIISDLINSLLKPIMQLIDSILSVVDQFVSAINSLAELLNSTRIGVGFKIFAGLFKSNPDLQKAEDVAKGFLKGDATKLNLLKDSINLMDFLAVQSAAQGDQLINAVAKIVGIDFTSIKDLENQIAAYISNKSCFEDLTLNNIAPQFAQRFLIANTTCPVTQSSGILSVLDARKEKVKAFAKEKIAGLEVGADSCTKNYYIKTTYSYSGGITSGALGEKLAGIGEGITIQRPTQEECQLVKDFAKEKRDIKKKIFDGIQTAILTGGSALVVIGAVFMAIFQGLIEMIKLKFEEVVSALGNLAQAALSFNAGLFAAFVEATASVKLQLANATGAFDFSSLFKQLEAKQDSGLDGVKALVPNNPDGSPAR